MGVHLYTNGAWSDSGKIYRNSNNLFDISAFINGIVMTRGTYNYNSETNTLSITATGDDAHTGTANTYHIPVSELTTYTISTSSNNVLGRIFAFENGVVSGESVHSSATNTLTFTTLEGTEFLIIRIGCANEGTTKEYINLRINECSTSLPYEPYNVVDWYANNGHSYSSGAWG